MTDLEDRLRSLADTPVPGPVAPADLRHRAARRTRRRRAGVVLPLVVAAAIGGVLVTRPDDSRRVTAGEGPSRSTTTAASPSTATTTAEVGGAGGQPIGDLAPGITLGAEPVSALHDGDPITITVQGYRGLDQPAAVFCAGDVTEASASSRCDLSGARTIEWEPDPAAPLVARATVVATRVINVSRPGDADDGPGYDCATEPAGCVLAVAPLTPPVRGIAVAVSFVADELPQPTIILDRATGLDDGDPVTVSGSGFRPNSAYSVAPCRTPRDGPGSGADCDEIVGRPVEVATASPEGTFTATVAVPRGFYGYAGRTDCAVHACSLVVREPSGLVAVSAPITFAADSTFPTPVLAIEPDGPYRDEQEVTVIGTGFPPGADIGDQLANCPADKDPAKEERCGYPLAFAPVVVGPDGTFRTPFRLQDQAGWGHPCRTGPGCVLAWVIPKGPFGATPLPLTFGP